jgi:hypothetical protein
MLKPTGVKIGPFEEGEVLIVQKEIIPKLDTILAVPLSELLSV